MTDKHNDKHFNDIYKEITPEEIPWNNEQPPELLVELVESGQVKAGKTLDLGCGLGNYAIWLAGKGFNVVGVDASPTAIKIARRNAKDKGVKCKFVVGDVTGSWADFGTGFDFVYD